MKGYVITTSIEELNKRLGRREAVTVLLLFNEVLKEASIYDLVDGAVVNIYNGTAQKVVIIDWGRWNSRSKTVRRAQWKGVPVRK